MKWLWRALLIPVRWLLALLILFEELGWEPLQRALGRLASWPLFAWIERRIAALPSYAALAILVLPSLLLIPIKLLALAAIARGHAVVGLMVIVIAKIAGTALVARLFLLTRPALMKLAWFARWHARWTVWKNALLAQVRGSALWRSVRTLKAGVQRTLRRWRRALGGATRGDAPKP